MDNKVLSVFVDESGKFQYPDLHSRFYIVGMIFHDQSFDVSGLIAKLDADWLRMGLSDFCFHAGPIIRREKGYRYMLREQRTAIFARMLLFARHTEGGARCAPPFVVGVKDVARPPRPCCKWQSNRFVIGSACWAQ